MKTNKRFPGKFEFFSSQLVCFVMLYCISVANASTTSVPADKFPSLQQEVLGTVIDQAGTPIMGVTVVVKGTTLGTTTDLDGKFSIPNVPDDATTLVFSFIGMKTAEIPIDRTQEMQVVMEEETTMLDELVVIGYGTTKKSDLTGAVASVNSEDFEKQPVSRVEEALQGRAAGVQVIKNSGAPGSEVKIRVRGANSINGSNQPLVVIDGVIGADLRSINTNDIASMEILKDASATAIYGSRGANGVVLITTKRGKGKPSINVDYFTSVSTITKKVDILSPEEFGTIHGLPVIDGGTDYQKEYFTNGFTNNAQVSLSGKNENTGYFISGNILDQKGTSINSEYQRYSLRANLDTKVSDRFSVQLNLYGSSENTLNLVNGGRSSSPDHRAGIVALLGWDPTLPLRDDQGNYNLISSNGSGLINPIAQRLESDARGTANTANANINLSYDIADNLNLTVIGGLLYRNNLAENYFGIPAGTVMEDPTGNGSTNYAITLQNSNILTWDKAFDKHNIKVTGLFEIQKFTNKGFTANGGQYSIPANFYSLDLGTNPTVRARLSKSEIHSYMLRGEYNFDQTLFLTGTIRADVSSRFRPENQTGYFPSLSVAYQFKDLFDGSLDRLKLRAGYGEVGNQGISPYSTYNTLQTGLNYPLDGTNEVPGIGLGAIANPDLTWETTRQVNVGLDASFMNGRINFSANKYWKNTTDLLLDVPLPNFTGGGAITKNVGEVFNGGWEFEVQSSLVSTDKFNWDMNLTYSHNSSEIKELSEGRDEILISPVGRISNTSGDYIMLKVGEPLGQFYGATFLGTYKTGDPDGTPGNAKYLEDSNGVVLGIIGNGVPSNTWAVNSTLTYGNFDLNFLLRGVHGFDVYNFTRGKISMAGGVQSLPTHGDYRNRWTPQNETDIPAGGNLLVNSTRFVEKGDFIRLSNLALGYNMDFEKIFKSIRIYVSAQNLFTITDYSGYDPEASSIGADSGAAASIDYGANPNSRTFVFGVKLGF